MAQASPLPPATVAKTMWVRRRPGKSLPLGIRTGWKAFVAGKCVSSACSVSAEGQPSLALSPRLGRLRNMCHSTARSAVKSRTIQINCLPARFTPSNNTPQTRQINNISPRVECERNTLRLHYGLSVRLCFCSAYPIERTQQGANVKQRRKCL